MHCSICSQLQKHPCNTCNTPAKSNPFARQKKLNKLQVLLDLWFGASCTPVWHQQLAACKGPFTWQCTSAIYFHIYMHPLSLHMASQKATTTLALKHMSHLWRQMVPGLHFECHHQVGWAMCVLRAKAQRGCVGHLEPLHQTQWDDLCGHLHSVMERQ